MDKLTDLKERYHVRFKDYTENRGKEKQIKDSIEKTNEKVKAIKLKIEQLNEVNTLFKLTSDYAREQSKEQIESIVSSCLSLIFEKPMKFIIDRREMRNKSSAEFYVLENEDDIPYNILESKGGGVVDIISLSLRVAFLMKYHPQIQGPLILDEPAKHVSKDFIFNVADFLQKVSTDFNRQIILISHDEHLASMSDRSYYIEKDEGFSKVTELSMSSS